MDLRELYQQYLDLPYYRRVLIGKDCLKKIKRFLRSKINGNNKIKDKDGFATIALIGSLRRFIGADGTFDQDEYEFLNDIFETNFDYDKMLELLNSDFFSSYKMSNSLGALLDLAPNDIRISFVSLGMLICVADGMLTYEERRAIEKMMH